MTCMQIREAISALLDNEASPLSQSQVDHHLETCAECADFRIRAVALRSTVKPIELTDAPDLAAAILAPERRAPRGSTGYVRILRLGIAAMAAGEFLSSLAAFLLQLHRLGPDHASHESLALTGALCAGLAYVARRPEVARPYVPIMTAATGLLLLAAGIDISAHRVTPLDELPHLDLLAGCAMLWLLARHDLQPPSAAVSQRKAPRSPGPRRGLWIVNRSLARRRAGVQAPAAALRDARAVQQIHAS